MLLAFISLGAMVWRHPGYYAGDEMPSESEPEPAQSDENHDTYFKIHINYLNYDDDAFQQELITVFNSEGTITNTIRIYEDGLKSALNTKCCRLYSNYLDKSIDIPEVADDEIVVFDIDYSTGNVETSIIKC